MEQIVVVGADPVLDLVRAAPFAFQWEFALNVYRDNGGWGGIRTSLPFTAKILQNKA